MKQKLFVLVSVAAVLASCTNDDFLTEERGQSKVDLSKGIVFKVANEATTRGEFNTDAEGNFYTGWNAEIDRIGVIYSGAVKGLESNETADAGIWNEVADAKRGEEVVGPVDVSTTATGGPTPNLAIYKTTRSGSQGWVTGLDDGNILKFAAEESDPDNQVKASFRVFRPVSVSAGTVTPKVEYSCTAEGVETMKATVAAFNAQTQPTLKANFANFFMVANPINDIYSSDNAVGEELNLNFERPFAALAVRTKGYDQKVYGALKTVTVTMTQSDIAYSDPSSVDIAKKTKDGSWKINEGTGVKIVTLTVGKGSGLDWSDDAWAFMQILPVDRSKLKAAEDYTIKLTFENGDVTIKKSSSNNWTANSFVKVTADLAEQDYLYLGATSNKVMIVNKAMPVLDASNQFDGVAASSITHFVSKIELSKDQLTTVKTKFTGITNMTLSNQSADLGDNLSNMAAGITSLTLTKATTAPKITSYAGLTILVCPEVTTIPDGAYKENDVITQFTFPKVQTIGDDAFNGATGATTIGCGTEKLIIGTTDLKTTAKTSALTSIGSFAFNGVAVEKVDAPALTTMGSRAFGSSALGNVTSVLLPKYNFADAYNAMALLGGDNLAEVDLSSVDELGLTTISFANNANLVTVTLKEGAKIGKSAFSGCSKLAEVNNLDKAATIGENAFMNTALTNVLLNTATIGADAFNGCTALATVTLGANVKNIAEGAFSGCSVLATVNNLANIEAIGKDAFKGTKVDTFDYLNATLGEGAFQGCTGLKGQVRSNVTVLEKNVFNGANVVSSFVFPNVTTIKEGALQGLLESSTYANITFGTALTAIDAKAFAATTTGNGDGTTAEKAKEATVNYKLIIADKTGLTVKNNTVTYKATDGKYYKITFQSVQ
ncbi:MAG: leucine-rich repeat domain-containing protein [Bacteroides sp.]|nr:leucine-rich repeat domain-containing protein [Bacteroides sp.]